MNPLLYYIIFIFILSIDILRMDALQEKLAAWLPENFFEQLRSQNSANPAAQSRTPPWILEVR